VRALIRRLDAFLRWALGVYEFIDDEKCLLRLQVTRAPHRLDLGERVVEAGEPVLGLHLWNEHIRPFPTDGPDLTWAVQTRRQFVQSLRGAACEMKRDRRLASVRAVGAVTALLPIPQPGAVRLMARLGFEVVPYQNRLGRFGEFWENLYSWWLIGAFNPAARRGRRMLGLRRSEAWMSAEEFLRRYGDTAGD
jgi:hypothetical protein